MTDKLINDGGPAFARAGFYHPDGLITQDNEPADGMSLRDWFASTATEQDIVVICIQTHTAYDDFLARGQARYLHADAMLKQRAVDTPPGE